jgi:hypothetical protein
MSGSPSYLAAGRAMFIEGRNGRSLVPNTVGHVRVLEVAGHVLMLEVAGHVLMLEVAGFDIPRRGRPYMVPYGIAHPARPRALGRAG